MLHGLIGNGQIFKKFILNDDNLKKKANYYFVDLRNHGNSEHSNIFDLDSLTYDLDNSYELNPHLSILDAMANIAGVNSKDCEFFVKTAPPNVKLPQNYAVFHCDPNHWVGRNWKLDKFQEIAERLRKVKKVVLVGKSNVPFSCDLDLRGMNIKETAFIIQNSDIFIGMDAFPMWLAQAFNKKGVCFFGSVDPKLILINNNIIPVRDEALSCIACHHRKLVPIAATTNCEVGDIRCENVSVDSFWKEVEKIL